MEKRKQPQAKETPERNEGEGNRTAARHYNEAQKRFVRSGKVDEKAEEAKRAVEGRERKELEEAEAIGRRHTAEEDPDIKR
jgi:hypothetical protein